MLRLENICKSFGNKIVLNNVSLSLNKGEVYGLVGANGSGKTTMMNIIASVLKSNSGYVYVDDKLITNNMEAGKSIGYILDIPALFDYLTPKEYFEYLSSTEKITKFELKERIDDILSLVGLTGEENKRLGNYSRGMRQRFGIAAGLFNNPDIVMMDEPTSALDPAGRYEVLAIIENLKKQGKTVLLSTHILTDIERVCDRIGILKNGSIQLEGTIMEITKQYLKPIFEIVIERDMDKLYDLLSSRSYMKRIKNKGDYIKIEIQDDEVSKKALMSDVLSIDAPILKYSMTRPSLEKIFLEEVK